jgi:phosphoglycolate phosphatase-like HAD superfamily hydrolase
VKLLLFDIDGTLVHSGGAGLRAMTRAFTDLYAIPDALAGVSLSGRTDSSILQDALAIFALPHSPEIEEEYKQRYFELLAEEMPLPGAGKRLMPGIPALLEALSGRPDVHLGLLTGNWRTSGYLKLADFGLDRYFPFGAFADDSGVRDQLLPFAVARFRDLSGLSPRPEEVYVIGDTPYDIQCARPHGAVAVAVAAAAHSRSHLAACNPDHLFTDLEDTEAALQVLG